MAKKRGKKDQQLATRKRKRYAAGRNVAIVDRPGLARLISEVCAARYGSVARAAASAASDKERVKALRALLRRVIAGHQASIRVDSVTDLRRLAGSRRAEVENAMLTDRTRDRFATYNRWLETATYAARLGTLRGNGDIEGREGTASGHAVAHADLLASLRCQFAGEWEPLTRILQSHYADRAQLALHRVVAPLMDYYDSAGIERSPEEFSDDELRVFIKAGVKRECLMLNRDPDVQRAQAVPKFKGPGPHFDGLMEHGRVMTQQRLREILQRLTPADLQGNRGR